MGKNEKSKSAKWVKVLDAAGLLDEIEDGWSIPPGSPVEGSTIQVKGSGGLTIPPGAVGGAKKSPVDGRVSGVPPVVLNETEALPLTPVEKNRSSAPAKTIEAEEAVEVERAVEKEPAAGIDPKPFIPVTNAKETAIGIPRIPSSPPSVEEPGQYPDDGIDPGVPLEEPVLEPLEEISDEYEQVKLRPEEDRDGERVVTIGGTRISILPENKNLAESADAAIVDEPVIEDERPPLRSEAPEDLVSRMNALFEVGDFSGALDIAQKLLESDPGHFAAGRLRDSCKDTLIKMYESRIGHFDRAPTLSVSNHELIWRDLDPSAGFVLSRVDGFSTFEDIIDISGLSRFETCRILDRLLQDGIIS